MTPLSLIVPLFSVRWREDVQGILLLRLHHASASPHECFCRREDLASLFDFILLSIAVSFVVRVELPSLFALWRTLESLIGVRVPWLSSILPAFCSLFATF